MTARRERFAELIADGMSQSDAYREAYPRSLTYQKDVVWRRASELAANSEVKGRVDELRAALQKRNLWTREQSIAELQRALEMAEKSTDVVATIREMNAMHGFNAPQKHEVTGGLFVELLKDITGNVLKPR